MHDVFGYSVLQAIWKILSVSLYKTGNLVSLDIMKEYCIWTVYDIDGI